MGEIQYAHEKESLANTSPQMLRPVHHWQVSRGRSPLLPGLFRRPPLVTPVRPERRMRVWLRRGRRLPGRLDEVREGDKLLRVQAVPEVDHARGAVPQ